MKIVEKFLFIPICCVCDHVRDDQQTSARPAGGGLRAVDAVEIFPASLPRSTRCVQAEPHVLPVMHGASGV